MFSPTELRVASATWWGCFVFRAIPLYIPPHVGGTSPHVDWYNPVKQANRYLSSVQKTGRANSNASLGFTRIKDREYPKGAKKSEMNENSERIQTEEGELYEIKLKGHLDEHWSEWFDNLAIAYDEHDNTILAGPVADQSELHGLLKKVHDLGLSLISVTRVESDSI